MPKKVLGPKQWFDELSSGAEILGHDAVGRSRGAFVTPVGITAADVSGELVIVGRHEEEGVPVVAATPVPVEAGEVLHFARHQHETS